MSRARELAKLGNTDAVGIDGVDLRAGSVSKGTNLDVATDVKVVGVVTAANTDIFHQVRRCGHEQQLAC